MIPQGTTPTFVLTLPEGFDLTQASKVVASFCCSGKQVNVEPPELELTPTTASAHLTQEQTMGWEHRSPLKVQLNWLTQDGVRLASEVWEGVVDEQLLTEVMS